MARCNTGWTGTGMSQQPFKRKGLIGPQLDQDLCFWELNLVSNRMITWLCQSWIQYSLQISGSILVAASAGLLAVTQGDLVPPAPTSAQSPAQHGKWRQERCRECVNQHMQCPRPTSICLDSLIWCSHNGDRNKFFCTIKNSTHGFSRDS
jgi:hypothetical protein